MSNEKLALILIALSGWFALWWLAVRAVFGRLFGFLEWLPVLWAAFGFPMLMTDVIAVTRLRFSAEWFLAGWAGVALLIDGVWVGKRIGRWLR